MTKRLAAALTALMILFSLPALAETQYGAWTIEVSDLTLTAGGEEIEFDILVLALGVALLIPLQPVLQAPALQPAFDSVVPALFGAMAYQYFRGHMNMAVWPLVLMGVLFTLLPSLVANTSMMVLPAGAAAFLAGYLRTKKHKMM